MRRELAAGKWVRLTPTWRTGCCPWPRKSGRWRSAGSGSRTTAATCCSPRSVCGTRTGARSQPRRAGPHRRCARTGRRRGSRGGLQVLPVDRCATGGGGRRAVGANRCGGPHLEAQGREDRPARGDPGSGGGRSARGAARAARGCSCARRPAPTTSLACVLFGRPSRPAPRFLPVSGCRRHAACLRHGGGRAGRRPRSPQASDGARARDGCPRPLHPSEPIPGRGGRPRERMATRGA